MLFVEKIVVHPRLFSTWWRGGFAIEQACLYGGAAVPGMISRNSIPNVAFFSLFCCPSTAIVLFFCSDRGAEQPARRQPDGGGLHPVVVPLN